MESLAPIVLLTYNRPWHTQQILNSLAENNEAKNSTLYIFCDGAKENVDADGLLIISKVRDICKKENRFKKVIITHQNKNKGLANSVIDGVTQVVNNHGRVIVVEDDLILSPFFLSYMNDALDRYETNLSVGQIGACNFFACGKKYPDYFFAPLPDCLGWATWKNRWEAFNSNVNELKNKLNANESKKNIFNAYGSYDFMGMLEQQKNGKVDSWAIRWQAVCVLKGWLTLYPNPSMTNHVESAEATHANVNIVPPIAIKKPKFRTIEVKEIEKVIKAFKLGYSGKGDYYGNEKKEFKIKKIKAIVKQFIPPFVLKVLKRNKKGKVQKSNEIWSGNYFSWEEVQTKCTGYDSATILEKCKESLLKIKNGQAVYERDSVLFDEIQYSWGLLAGLQKAALESKGKLCVLDFGGSLGSTYYQNKEFLNEIENLEWNIVEQAHFVDCGKKYFEDDELKFYYSIDECLSKHEPNVLLLSSVLQYLSDINYWLDKFNDSGIDYVLIDRTTSIPSDENIITIQEVPSNIYNASYPCWFFNQDYIKDSLSNYSLITSFDGAFDPVGYRLNDSVIANWKGYIFRIK